MEKRASPAMHTGSGMDLAFAVVVLASYLATFSSVREATLPKILLLILLGVTYVNLGIYGYSYVSKSEFLWIRLAYFFIQIPIGCLIIFLGGGVGYNAMVLLPLAGQSVVLLTEWWLYGANFAVGLSFLVASRLLALPWTSIWSNLLTFLAGQVFIVVFTQMALDEQRSRKEVERLVVELREANDQLRAYAVQVEELAITRERNRMAREIHDGLGHYLTTIHMQIRAGRAVAKTDPIQAEKLFSKAQGLAQDALQDIRQSVAALRSSPEDNLPLVEVVQKVLDGCECLGLDAELIVEGSPRPLPPAVHLTFFRAVQEGVNNTCKHANAKHIQVDLDYSEPGSVGLAIRDDGKGSDTTDGGFGLIGLRERVTQLQGEMEVHTEENRGFEVILRVPVKNDQNPVG